MRRRMIIQNKTKTDDDDDFTDGRKPSRRKSGLRFQPIVWVIYVLFFVVVVVRLRPVRSAIGFKLLLWRSERGECCNVDDEMMTAPVILSTQHFDSPLSFLPSIHSNRREMLFSGQQPSGKLNLDGP